MRITESRFREIVRESLRRRFLNEAVGGEVNKDLLAALYWVSTDGRGGKVYLRQEAGQDILTYKTADMQGRRFVDLISYNLENFMSMYIKPARREFYGAELAKLEKEGKSSSGTGYVDFRKDDFQNGFGSLDMRMKFVGPGIEGKLLTNISRYTPEQIESDIRERARFLPNMRILVEDDIKEDQVFVGTISDGVLSVQDAIGLIPAGAPDEVEKPIVTDAEMYKEWLESVSTRPLRQGSTGNDVMRAQVLLVAALKEASSRSLDLPKDGKGPSVMKSLQDMAKNKKIDGSDVKSMIQSLAEKIEAGGPDGKFGQMTKLATEIVQVLARSTNVDGVIGKDTGSALISGFKRPTIAQQGDKKTGEMLEESTGRWSRLAGIL